MDLAAATARDVAHHYGKAKGIRYLPEENAFCCPDCRKVLRHILFGDVCRYVGKGNGAKARAVMVELEALFAVPHRPASPGVLADWTREYDAFAGGEGVLGPDAWREARVSATSKVGTMVITPLHRHPRIRLYVTASPYWIGLPAGEWEPRPGRQNAPS